MAMVLMYGMDFQKLVCETAIEGIGKVLAEHKESISKDYKIMQNLRCKGGKPASITVKIETANPIINSLDVSKHQTPLEKEIKGIQNKPQAERKPEDSDEEDHLEENVETKPDGITQPKFKIIYSYPVGLD